VAAQALVTFVAAQVLNNKWKNARKKKKEYFRIKNPPNN
jgi:hypothetical protein